MWAAFPSVGPLPTVGMLSSSKKKRKVFTHNSRPLNGILVPLTAKWFPKKKVFTRNSVTSNENRGPLTGYAVFPKIIKRSSTIIRGLQMESVALRQLRGSLTTLLWDLDDGLLKYSFMDSYTPMGPGQIAPCNPQPPSYKPWMGGSCSVSFVSLTFSWDNYSTVLEQKMKFWQKVPISFCISLHNFFCLYSRDCM